MVEQKTVSLPKTLEEHALEDYISALFQARGYYIERNVIKREIEKILELDIITTEYTSGIPETEIIEVKSGEWGYPDIFKLRGWLDYLNKQNATLIHTKEHETIDECIKISESLGIKLLAFDNSEIKHSNVITNKPLDERDLLSSRMSFWLERATINSLNLNKKQTYKTQKRFNALAEYYFTINNTVFFIENIYKKVANLYTIYQKFPHISAKCGNEMLGNDFDQDVSTLDIDIFKDTFNQCQFNDVQISTYVEHRARLAILKGAVDYLIMKRQNRLPQTSGLDVWECVLPRSFKHGLDALYNDKFLHRYPIFWQWFLWIFGGFILVDLQEKEYSLLSEKTGIPVSEIPNAIKAYETLFPTPTGWFIKASDTSRIAQMKMFPVPFRGIGVNYRRYFYCKESNLEEMRSLLTGTHTYDDLIKWNNLEVDILFDDKSYKSS